MLATGVNPLNCALSEVHGTAWNRIERTVSGLGNASIVRNRIYMTQIFLMHRGKLKVPSCILVAERQTPGGSTACSGSTPPI